MSQIAKATTKKPEAKKEASVSRAQKTDLSQSMNSPVDQILFLQRTIGNRAVQRLIRSGALQAKLAIGKPGDIYEQEADRVAEQVLRTAEPEVRRQPEEEEEEELVQPKLVANAENSIQRQVEVEEEELIQTKVLTGHDAGIIPDLESHIQAIQGGGKPLTESERAYFEPRFGYDFSQVRVHSDAQAAESARAVNARAFTVGRDVMFGVGQYAPETPVGKRLMAHELTHVVQQGKRPVNARLTAGFVRGIDAAKTYRGIGQIAGRVIQKEEGPFPRTAEEVVAGGEQKVRDQAGRIIDKLQALMRRYAGALLNFKATLDAPSSKDVQPQIGKVLLDYATDKVIGEVAQKIPGANYVYDIYKEVEKENKRVETARAIRQVAEFFKKHNKWITDKAAHLESIETEAEMDAEKTYLKKPSTNEKAIYWLQLKTTADRLDRHFKMMTQDRIFILLSEKWIAESKTTVSTLSMSAYVEIKLDKNWKVTKAHIHAPGGQKIADEFNTMKGGTNPLNLKARKVIFAEGYTLTSPVSGNPFLFQAQLGPSNEYTYGNEKLFRDIKSKSLPSVNRWTGD